MALVFAVMHLYTPFDFSFLLSVPSFFNTLKKKSGIDKSTEWSTIPACPSLMRFLLKRGNTEGTNSSKKHCSMFVYVFFFCVCVAPV